MSRVVEKWADGRAKTIKSDAKNTIYPPVGKGSLPRKMDAEMKAKYEENMNKLFPGRKNKAVAAEDDSIREELRKFRESAS